MGRGQVLQSARAESSLGTEEEVPRAEQGPIPGGQTGLPSTDIRQHRVHGLQVPQGDHGRGRGTRVRNRPGVQGESETPAKTDIRQWIRCS